MFSFKKRQTEKFYQAYHASMTFCYLKDTRGKNEMHSDIFSTNLIIFCVYSIEELEYYVCRCLTLNLFIVKFKTFYNYHVRQCDLNIHAKGHKIFKLTFRTSLFLAVI